jgi:hypothetical protein
LKNEFTQLLTRSSVPATQVISLFFVLSAVLIRAYLKPKGRLQSQDAHPSLKRTEKSLSTFLGQ